MGDANRGIGHIHMLASMPRCAENIDTEVILINLHIHFLRFRKHGNRDCRSVYPTLCFSFRDPLHTVYTTLMLQTAVDLLTLYEKDNLFEPANTRHILAQDFRLPPFKLSIPCICSEKIGSKKGRLFSTCASPYF